MNAPPELIELDSKLRYLRTVRLEGFSDTEGVAYLGEGRFAVVDVRCGILSRFRFDEYRVGSAARGRRVLQVAAPEYMAKNHGREGVTYSSERWIGDMVSRETP